jgi:hypothetical protein
MVVVIALACMICDLSTTRALRQRMGAEISSHRLFIVAGHGGLKFTEDALGLVELAWAGLGRCRGRAAISYSRKACPQRWRKAAVLAHASAVRRSLIRGKPARSGGERQQLQRML